MNIHLISESMNIDETVEFLVDTGASRTTLLDKDAIYLDLDYDKLPKYKENLRGIGGPCPAALLLGFTEERPCHVVIAQCKDHARVITVYIPEKDKWIDNRIRRD
jgi:hypothetical protein